MKVQLFILFCISIYTINCNALSPDAEEGRTLYPACHVCHNQAMDPPLGPPIWGVKRRYIKNTFDNKEFVQKMVDFVKAPKLEIAIHDEAIKQLGLMPPMPLPDEMLIKISTYILEEQFPPPCDHWRIALKRSLKNGDTEHARKEQRQINRFCK